MKIQVFSNSLGQEELEAVKKVFLSRWIGMGKETAAFEQELGKLFGCNNVLTVNCCTAALFISMKVLGIGPGDEVIIPSINFIGTANAVLDVGAKPVFADVDPVRLNIIPSEIERLRNKNTKAVLLLHYGGHPCDFDAVSDVSKGLYIIEDSANSLVSKYKGKNCGTLGDLGCFSFDAMKILSVGDGGALIVKDDIFFQKACEYRYFGICNNKSGIDSLKAKNKKWWEIELKNTSGRYISNDIVSAIGRVQLQKLDDFIRRRKQIWELYQKKFQSFSWIQLPPKPLPGTTTSYYLYWIMLEPKIRNKLANYLVEQGIYCTFRYYPLHLIKAYNTKVSLRNSEYINDRTLNIPLHQNLTDNDIDLIFETINSFTKKI